MRHAVFAKRKIASYFLVPPNQDKQQTQMEVPLGLVARPMPLGWPRTHYGTKHIDKLH